MAKVNNSTSEDALGGCLLFILLLVLAPFSVWLSAWVTLQMYNWFILPFVPNSPTLNIIPFIGMSCIVGMYTAHLSVNQHSNTKPDGTKMEMKDVFGWAFSRMFIYPLLALGFAWVYQFIFIR